MKLHKRTGSTSIVAGVALVMIGFTTSGPATSPGNNGTIKVDGWEVDNTPGNEPHVGCTFGIDFYGFEASLPVTMQFAVQPPTGDEVIFTQQGILDDDDASGGGSEAGHDGHFDIDLTEQLANFIPQQNQGYHLELTVTVDDFDAQGAQVKHKVFWVTECGPPPTTTTTIASSTTAPPESTTTTTIASSTTAPPESTTTMVSPDSTSAPTTATQPTTIPDSTTGITTTTIGTDVAPQAVQKPPTQRPPSDGSETTGPEVFDMELARTGFGSALLAIGAALVLLGVGLEGYRFVTRRSTGAG